MVDAARRCEKWPRKKNVAVNTGHSGSSVAAYIHFIYPHFVTTFFLFASVDM